MRQPRHQARAMAGETPAASAKGAIRGMMRDVALGGLTPRQLQVYRFIERFIAERGYSPSFEEIRTALGLKSKTSVHGAIQRLVARGFITIAYGRSRSIALPARAA